MDNKMICEIVEMVKGNIVYECKEHRPDSYIVIPHEDALLAAKSNTNGIEILEVTLDDIKNKQWATVTCIVTAVDIARGEDFCIKAVGMTIEEYIAYDYAEFESNTLPDALEEDNACGCCTGYHSSNYDTGEKICDHRCSVA